MRANDGDRRLSDSMQSMLGAGATVSGTTSTAVLLGRDQGRIAFFVGVAAFLGGVALVPFTSLLTGLVFIGVGLLLAIVFRIGAIATEVTYNQLVILDSLRQLLAHAQDSTTPEENR